MSDQDVPQASNLKLCAALERRIEALRLLDGAQVPGDVGSHLDLAIARLERDLEPEVRRHGIAQSLLAQLMETEPGKLHRSEPDPWDSGPV